MSSESDARKQAIEEYSRRRASFERQQEAIVKYVRGLVGVDARVDQVVGRTKSVASFAAKAGKSLDDGAPRYANPFVDIQDLIGIRIVVFYASDVGRIRELVLKQFRALEDIHKAPERDAEFAYFGLHFILESPADFDVDGHGATTFELQVKTLWEHAWSQACHDLVYKAPCAITPDDRRRAALASASAWGNDRLLDELFLSISARGGVKQS